MRMLTFVCALGLAACGGGEAAAPPVAGPSGATPLAAGSDDRQTFAAQVAVGQKLYGDNCASCHGPGGEGKSAPRVVGLDKGALPLDPPAAAKYRKTQFKNAADVAGFVVKSMPPNAPGSLKEADYWAILAFDLHANGVDLPKKLDASAARDVVLHP